MRRGFSSALLSGSSGEARALLWLPKTPRSKWNVRRLLRLIPIVARTHEDREVVPLHEQWIAVGASIGNLMPAANALGYAGKVLSGARAGSSQVRAEVCETGETLVGFVYLDLND